MEVTLQTSYSDARARLAELLDRVGENHEMVIISRRGHADVALVSADELRSLEETAHLMRSPTNARRLLEALQRSVAADVEAASIDELAEQVGLGDDVVAPPR